MRMSAANRPVKFSILNLSKLAVDRAAFATQ
jgi:hypothetical protein